MIERVVTAWGLAAVLAVAGCAGIGSPRRVAADPQAVASAAGSCDAELVAAAMAFIEPFEGRRSRVYLDSLGHPTIGVGFNLDRTGAADDLAELLPGVSYRAVRRGDQRLTDAQVDVLLRHDVGRALEAARRHVPNLDRLPREAQLVLIDMSFNLGSLSAWHDLRAAVAATNFDAAAAAMYDSRWRTQTGRRATRLIAIMESLG